MGFESVLLVAMWIGQEIQLVSREFGFVKDC